MDPFNEHKDGISGKEEKIRVAEKRTEAFKFRFGGLD